MRSTKRSIALIAATIALVAACSPGAASPTAPASVAPASATAAASAAASDSPSAAPSASQASARFTAEEVLKETGQYQVVPIYEVPRTLKKKYLLAFLNPGRSVPFFVDWSDGMNAAAKFYGVDLIETDLELKFENTVSSYETISARNPDVVGTLTTAGTALKAVTDPAGIPVIPIDIAIEGNPYYLGVPNEKSGMFAGAFIGPEAAKKMAGEWKGKTIVYIGLGSAGNEEVNKRIRAALPEIRKSVEVLDSNVVELLCDGQAEPCIAPTTDTLTAHPNDVFVVVAMNDEAGLGALQAIKSQNRTADAIMVTQGSDKVGRDMLRSDSDNVMLGAVDYNPWAEGWSWVEAAIAVAEGETFREYDVNRIVTRENLNEAYPGEQ